MKTAEEWAKDFWSRSFVGETAAVNDAFVKLFREIQDDARATGGYNDVKAHLTGLPMTWYPGLLVYLTEQAIKAKVFQPGGASRMVKKLEHALQSGTQTPSTKRPDSGSASG